MRAQRRLLTVLLLFLGPVVLAESPGSSTSSPATPPTPPPVAEKAQTAEKPPAPAADKGAPAPPAVAKPAQAAAPAPAAAPGAPKSKSKTKSTVPAAPKPAEGAGATSSGVIDVAQWNDRTTPRKTLETFFFAIAGYDRQPLLISNAIECLDLSGLDPRMVERDAALLAHQLETILSRMSIPLYSLPDAPEGERIVVEEISGMPISLARQPDGLWKFDSETVGLIGRMRSPAARAQREADEARAKLAEGRTDPATTVRTFAGAAMGRHDFAAAARCLDLRDVPPKLRATEGADAARKLAFVMQRLAYLFTQEIPSSPDGYRYAWHSNHRGRIVLERIRLPEGQDAWLFNRGTLRNLDALVESLRGKSPDPRYALLGLGVGEEVLASSRAGRKPPPEVPEGLVSPRKALQTFIEAADSLEFDDEQADDLLGCMDLSALSPADAAGLGPRLGAKLEAVLRRLNVDLLAVPDTWEADPQVIGRDTEWQVTLSRGKDGAWRFDRETIARVSDMFDRLTPEQKTARERRSSFHSARQTMRTLLQAVNAADLDLASRCLDLEGIPPAAREELGSVLAYKLKYVLDRIGRVVLEEIPDEPDGPRYYFYRGPMGRIDLVRQDGDSRKGDWQFSRETVTRIESMFRNGVARRVAAGLDPGRANRVIPSFEMAPSLWIRCMLPGWLRHTVLGLDLYQWAGLAVALSLSGAASWVALRVAERLACGLLHLVKVDIARSVVAPKLRPLSLQPGLWSLYLLVRLLDLPAAVVAAAIPTVKVVWVALIGWTVLRLVDLVMVLYARSERLVDRRNLSDMIVPTAANGLKLLTVLAAVSGQVYLVGSAESLTRLLAGLGLVGLAASLAAQDTLKNFFGTLLLIGEHPFRIGDFVVIQEKEGTVESVGFRSTRLRTPEDSLLTIPNSVMAAALIDNRGARTCRRYRTMISLAYDTPTERMEALRDALRAFAASHPKVKADKIEIHLAALANSSVDMLLQVYFIVTTYGEEMACRDEFNREVLRLAAKLNVEIAFPTHTVQFAAGTAHDVPPPPKLYARDRAEHWHRAGGGHEGVDEPGGSRS